MFQINKTNEVKVFSCSQCKTERKSAKTLIETEKGYVCKRCHNDLIKLADWNKAMGGKK